MRTRNWRQYNQALVQRGSLTFLIDPSVMGNTTAKRGKKKGRPFQFSDQLVLMLMMMKVHFRLTYRMLEGFARSLQGLGQISFPVPTYSLVCKRAARLQEALPELSRRRPSVVILDASGVKVMGEGEWKVRVHGKSKRRQWLKIHIAIDAKSQEIVAEATTTSDVPDGKMTETLLSQVKGALKVALGDGAYDGRPSRKAIRDRGAKALIPPPKNGRLNGDPERDEAVRIIHGLGGDRIGRSAWGKLVGYSKRSLVEATFSRMKRLFSERLFSQTIERQLLETRLRCLILNKMTRMAA